MFLLKSLGGATFVPLRFVSEALGCSVEWEEKLRKIAIIPDSLVPSSNTENPSPVNIGSQLFSGSIPDHITKQRSLWAYQQTLSMTSTMSSLLAKESNPSLRSILTEAQDNYAIAAKYFLDAYSNNNPQLALTATKYLEKGTQLAKSYEVAKETAGPTVTPNASSASNVDLQTFFATIDNAISDIKQGRYGDAADLLKTAKIELTKLVWMTKDTPAGIYFAKAMEFLEQAQNSVAQAWVLKEIYHEEAKAQAYGLMAGLSLSGTLGSLEDGFRVLGWVK